MRQCLTSPDGGYYTEHNENKDQFGQKGDFITSPEISQVFGELVGVWLVAEWMAQGRKSAGVEIIEVGPGRGTLMDDVLRTIRNFKPMAASINAVYLVEASPSLRNKQKQLLCDDAPLEQIDIGFRSRNKYTGLPVIWCEDIRFVPNDPTKSPFIFAHEFFDALPIHAFQSVTPSAKTPATIQGLHGPITLSKPQRDSQVSQWRELVVAASPPPPTTLTPPELPPSDFQLSLATASNPSSLLLPEVSARYRALKPLPGSVIEISPEARSYAAEFARRIGGSPQGIKPQPSGAALILDYGPLSTIPTSTLRGIRAHQLVSPFSLPGKVDISADVDFTALAEAAVEASAGVEVHGPVEQGAWLERMGIMERAEMLEEKKAGDERTSVRRAVNRLVERGGGGMGRLYKVLAIVPERGGKKVVGFGGGVEGGR
ncbi:hypothetical protein MMC13_005683 [Lambiella insularis]|nr:hypothetical protein [Lambiella insularis]